MKLTEVENLVLPPVELGQVLIATGQAEIAGERFPLGAILWARVSNEVDQCLVNDRSAAPRLSPKDWNSGNIFWVITVLGEQRVIRPLIAKLLEMPGAEGHAKMRVVYGNGTLRIVELKPGGDYA